jgi:hypothetical protein
MLASKLAGTLAGSSAQRARRAGVGAFAGVGTPWAVPTGRGGTPPWDLT